MSASSGAAIDVAGVESYARHDGPEARVTCRSQLVQLGPEVTVGIGPGPRVRRDNLSHGVQQPRRRRNLLVDISACRELQRRLRIAKEVPGNAETRVDIPPIRNIV